MWDALQDITRRQHVTVHDLVTEIDRGRSTAGLTAAIRVYIVNFYRAAALPAGRAQPTRRAKRRDPPDPELHHIV